MTRTSLVAVCSPPNLLRGSSILTHIKVSFVSSSTPPQVSLSERANSQRTTVTVTLSFIACFSCFCLFISRHRCLPFTLRYTCSSWVVSFGERALESWNSWRSLRQCQMKFCQVFFICCALFANLSLCQSSYFDEPTTNSLLLHTIYPSTNTLPQSNPILILLMDSQPIF